MLIIFFVLGKTEKIPLLASTFLPLLIFILLNSIMITKINEK